MISRDYWKRKEQLMGRDIKRVPVGFDWPINEVWTGYLMPDKYREDKCPDCDSGRTPALSWVEAITWLLPMLADDLRSQSFAGTEHQFTPFGDDRSKIHPYLSSLMNVHTDRRPSADIAELIEGLTGEKPGMFGYISSSASWKITAKLREAAGVDENWGYCTTCGGHSSIENYPGQRAEAEAWECTEPPTGDGWQVWETVSEGSPISPVFADRESLIAWLMSPAYTWGTSRPLSRQQAEVFVASAWAPSGAIIDGQMVTGDAMFG